MFAFWRKRREIYALLFIGDGSSVKINNYRSLRKAQLGMIKECYKAQTNKQIEGFLDCEIHYTSSLSAHIEWNQGKEFKAFHIYRTYLQ